MKKMMQTVVLPALVVLGIGLTVRGQFTPGTGGTYTPVPTPSTPPAQPPYVSQPAPPYQQVPGPPAQADMVKIEAGPTFFNGIEYIATPQGYIPKLSDAQVGDLTASIALYPDPLLATILPAATYVEELTYAEKWMGQHPGADERTIWALPVDDSVKSLMHYPTVLAMMTDHLDWTQALGMSFLYQRPDVMEAVQRWRRLAYSYGTLASTPQFDVFRQGDQFLILPPPRAQVIYVPVYDPQVVYVRPRRPVPMASVFTFSAGGFSLSFIDNDLDWHDHDVRVPIHHDHDWDHDVPGRGGPDRGGRGDRGGGGGSGDRGGSGRGGDPGRGGGRSGSSIVVTPGGSGSPIVVTPDKKVPPEKKVFVRDSTKSGIIYPDKIVTPTGDKKVVTIPAATKPAPPMTVPAATLPAGRGAPGGGM